MKRLYSKLISGAIPSDTVVTLVLPTLDKDKEPSAQETTTDPVPDTPTSTIQITPPTIFVVHPRPTYLQLSSSAQPAEPSTSSKSKEESEYDLSDPKNQALLLEAYEKLKEKSKKQEETNKRLDAANKLHISEKKQLRKELVEERWESAMSNFNLVFTNFVFSLRDHLYIMYVRMF